jgi:glutamate dehydrogenase/leucine dehydrogenase
VNRIGQLRQGVVKVVENDRYTPSLKKKYTIADLCTGFGVAEAVRHYYDIWGGSLKGKRAIVQGWGNVGAAAGFYLSKLGVRIVGIVSHEGGLINQAGFSEKEIQDLVINRNRNKLASPDLLPFYIVNEKIWDLDYEIFIPAASSRLLTRSNVDRMISAKIEVIACGANVPFADPGIFLGPIGLYADENFSVIPDFIANCGMARVFAYFMENEVRMDDASIFSDISRCIRNALL